MSDSEKLAGLLNFAAGILSARGKTRLRIDSEKLGCFREQELAGLPGLQLPESADADVSSTWLRLDRIKTSKPPLPREGSELADWLDQHTVKNPESEPQLLPLRVFKTTFGHAKTLLRIPEAFDAGIELLEDPLSPTDTDEQSAVTPLGCESDASPPTPASWDELADEQEVRVTLKLADFPAVTTAFQQWRDKQWAGWVKTEVPVRQSAAIYKKLFKLHTTLHSGDSSANELVWGVGMAEYGARTSTKRLDIPVIEFLIDIDLLDNGTISLAPRDVPAYLNLRPLMEAGFDGAEHAQPHLQNLFQQLRNNEEAELTPFSVTELETYFATLVGQVSSDAELMDRAHVNQAIAADAWPERDPEKLRIHAGWAIYGRPRSSNFRVDDLNQLNVNLGKLGDSHLPLSLCGFVQPLPGNEAEESFDGPRDYPADWGDFVRQQHQQRQSRYYFPLASNEDQNQIIEQLERHPVVTVTGPPGTGKTHSIANIVAHYMATGKRVLVTARTPEAISAVQSKLPPELGDLVIASVASDREGARQLESAIQRLSDEVVHLNEQQLQAEIRAADDAIVKAEKDIVECEAVLAQISQRNLTPLRWRGESTTVMELAVTLDELQPQFGWFADRPAQAADAGIHDLMSRIVNTLQQYPHLVAYAFAPVPDPADLPGTRDLLDCREHYMARAAEPQEDFSNEPKMALDTPDALNVAKDLESFLAQADLKFGGLQPWHTRLLKCVMQQHLYNAGAGELPRVDQLIKQWGGRRPPAVAIDYQQLDYDELLRELQDRLAGDKGSLFGKLFKSKLSGVLEATLVEGRPVAVAAEWQQVIDWVELDREVNVLRDSWSALQAEGLLPEAAAETHTLALQLADVSSKLDKARRAIPSIANRLAPYAELFPYGIDARQHLAELDFDRLGRAIRANLGTTETPHDIEHVLGELADRGTQPLFRQCRQLLDVLHGTTVLPATDDTAQVIVELRNNLTRELGRVKEVQPTLQALRQDVSSLAERGAPGFAEQLRQLIQNSSGNTAVSTAASANTLENTIADAHLTTAAETSAAATATAIFPKDSPANASQNTLATIAWENDWAAAWEWACARRELDEVLALGNGDEWRARKLKAVSLRQQRFLQLIQAKTRAGLKGRITPQIRSEFMRFTQAMGRLGAGTGKAAHRHRKTIKEAARKASTAVPVWIMPESKVSEQLPPDLGVYDLVILDEASQSDVTSIGVLSRGAKLLIVGDEKQVSPSAVGVTIDRVDQLRAEFLQDVPNRNSYDEKTSIFDIAMLRYPQSHLMLREHFRCVHPIIEFSTRFYEGRLVPLRVPRASERFDPPLVDVHIKGGSRNGKINEAEAQFIIEEIARLTSDPEHRHRDIAVISLIGAEQAEHIEKQLLDDPRIGPEVIERNHIVCGDSRTMQGQERSVVFLSMVADPGQARTQRSREDRQRFNVAMSRARDREYVVRSVGSQDLQPTDLKLEVLQHLRDPLPEGRAVVGQDVLSRCESGFERDVCRRLLDTGFRVRSQVAAGYYRIDLVVEGEDDTRLAIELDGDHWHGPEQWESDMARQVALERAGWTFWRVFGSQWYNNTEHYWRALLDTLESHRIKPIGGASVEGVFTEHRVIDITELNALGMSALADDASSTAPTAVVERTLDIDMGMTEPVAANASSPEVEPRPLSSANTAVTSQLENGQPEIGQPEIGQPEIGQPEIGMAAVAIPEPEISASTPMESVFTVTANSINKAAAPTTDSGAIAASSIVADAANADPRRFYDADYQQQLASLCVAIVNAAGPINFDDLAVRVARLHDFSRTGKRIQDAVRSAIQGRCKMTRHQRQPDVVWPGALEPSSVVPFRGITVAGVAREWEQLPWPEKVGLASLATIEGRSDPVSAMMRHLEISRAGATLRAEFDAALRGAAQLPADSHSG